jgi:hypothetical protein
LVFRMGIGQAIPLQSRVWSGVIDILFSFWG